jgi:hypothetical protein
LILPQRGMQSSFKNHEIIMHYYFFNRLSHCAYSHLRNVILTPKIKISLKLALSALSSKINVAIRKAIKKLISLLQLALKN